MTVWMVCDTCVFIKKKKVVVKYITEIISPYYSFECIWLYYCIALLGGGTLMALHSSVHSLRSHVFEHYSVDLSTYLLSSEANR